MDPYSMPAASLAYMGDAVYEILVREYLVMRQVKSPSVASLEYVKATAQSEALGRILPYLTDKENDVFHRGRNCIHNTPPKSCTPSEYRRATGLEALFGYLWLSGQHQRMQELWEIGIGAAETGGAQEVYLPDTEI